MDLYAGLFESMVSSCGRVGLRHGPVYTVAMIALGLAVSLNILSIIDLLWTLGVLHNPYQRAGVPHPQRYLCALLYVAFLSNTVLARLKFGVDRGHLRRSAHAAWAAPAYVLGSAGLFLITLPIELQSAP